MAHFVSTTAVTPADELRQLLTQSESLAVNIRGAGAAQGQTLLAALDRIQQLFPELEATGVNLQAEQVRWVGVQGAVRRHARSLLAELRPLGGLPALRSQSRPAAENWWWWLDESLRRQQQQRLRKGLLSAVAIVAFLFAARWLFGVLFPVDPAVAASHHLQVEAERAVDNGDVITALARIEEANRALPDNPSTLMWLVALYDVNGRPADADALEAELVRIHSPAAIYAGIGQVYIRMNRAEDALAYAGQAIAADPNYAQAHLVAGVAAELLTRYQDAVRYLEDAANLASAAGDSEVEAIARVHMGQILQYIGFNPANAAATPSPVP